MPKIIVHANPCNQNGRVTLIERVVAPYLNDERCATQLTERLAWATSHAQHLESPNDQPPVETQRTRRPSRQRATAPTRSRTRPRADQRRVST